MDSVERVSNGPGDAMTRNAASISMSTLEHAVGSGVITPEQLASILALAPAASFAPPEVTAPPGPAADGAAEARRGLNAVTIAYWVGAIAVLFAFGWFLVDRWRVLGAGAVLVITSIYATIFLVAARVLARHAFARASALALLLFVAMVPLVTWSVLSLTGYWDSFPAPRGSPVSGPVASSWDAVRWLPIDLTTLLAALAVWQRQHDSALTMPIAAALWFALVHLAAALFDPELLAGLVPQLTLVGAALFLSIGYALEQLEQRGHEEDDFALWFYVVGLLALFVGVASIWREAPGIVAHATLALAVLLVAAALYLRRRIFVIFAAAGLVAYLGYLAFDVFRKALGFPVVLATFGTAIILLAVWAQRRYPTLLRRTESAAGRPRSIPGGWEAFAGAVVVALAITLAHVPTARAEIGERQHRFVVQRWRIRNQRVLSKVRKQNAPATVRGPAPSPTPR